jgi:hypothetical protein
LPFLFLHRKSCLPAPRRTLPLGEPGTEYLFESGLRAQGQKGTACSALMAQRFIAREHLFGRWIVANADYPDYAWSGSQWVRIGGSVQISNFDTQDDAVAYAKQYGFTERRSA